MRQPELDYDGTGQDQQSSKPRFDYRDRWAFSRDGGSDSPHYVILTEVEATITISDVSFASSQIQTQPCRAFMC